MAKKRHEKKALAWKKQQQKLHRPGARLQEAQQALAIGNLSQALPAAEDALRTANDPATKKNAQAVFVEVHFRLAAASQLPGERLQHLEKALEQAPDQARLHYHRALTRWRMGDIAPAVAELEFVARQEPQRPGLTFLRQLGHVALGESWSADGLSPVEVNTLHLLQRVRQGEAPAENGDKPLLGHTPELWPLLLQMVANEKSAPLVRLQAVAQSAGNGATNPVLSYYTGVAAMRKGAAAAARPAWSQSAHYLAMPWLTENLLNLRRDIATELAQAKDWTQITELYEATVREVGAAALDPVLGEAAGLAYFHLGHAAAEANNWAVATDQWEKANQLIKNRQLAQNLALAAEANDDPLRAAEAWREMIRRRPRKENHPDYLSDDQVAAIWRHTAQCYGQEEITEEAVTCLKNALKYAPEDLELRLQLVDLLHSDGRVEATENELQRILEINPAYVPALTRLGVLYAGRWDRDAKAIWRRVLAAEPHNTDAQRALALEYIGEVRGDPMMMMGLGGPSRRASKQAVKVLEAGLKELPGQPLLLVELGNQYMELEKHAQARAYYEQAGRAAPKDVQLMSVVLHDLLHVDGGEIVKELVPQVRETPGLQPGFWVDQGEKVLECELGDPWAELFWDEAIQVAGGGRGGQTLAATLLRMFDAAFENGAEELAQKYERRLRTEYAHSGAVDYIEAVHAHDANPNRTTKTLSLLRKARSNANKANEPGIVEQVDDFEQALTMPAPKDIFGSLLNMFRDLDEEELDGFRRFR